MDNEAPSSRTHTEKGHPAVEFLLWIVDSLAAVRFAVWIVSIIALSCILGTVIPQGSSVLSYIEVHPERRAVMEWLTRIGITRVFDVWWFYGLLALLALSLLSCAGRRLKAAVRLEGRARGRAAASVVTHLSMVLILIGGVVRAVWGIHGSLQFHEGETRTWFRADAKRIELPFAIHLVDFTLEMHEQEATPKISVAGEEIRITGDGDLEMTLAAKPGSTATAEINGETVTVTVLDRVLDFVIDSQTGTVESRSDEPNNPAVQVETVWQGGASTNKQWYFARHPGFNMHANDPNRPPLTFQYLMQITAPPPPRIKDYKSTLEVIEDGKVVKAKTIEVNDPLKYGGYTFYQSGYNPEDLTWSSLQVGKDPSVAIVYTGFSLLILGLFVMFYMYPIAKPPRKRDE